MRSLSSTFPARRIAAAVGGCQIEAEEGLLETGHGDLPGDHFTVIDLATIVGEPCVLQFKSLTGSIATGARKCISIEQGTDHRVQDDRLSRSPVGDRVSTGVTDPPA